jgi:hypothetical protein
VKQSGSEDLKAIIQYYIISLVFSIPLESHFAKVEELLEKMPEGVNPDYSSKNDE